MNRTFLALLAFFALFAVSSWSGEANVTFLKGKAEVSASPSKPLSLGTIVKTGSNVTTFADTKVELKLDDGSVIRLGPNSSMLLKEHREDPATNTRTTSIDAKKGKVWLNIAKQQGWNNNFTVATPSAVAAVKGTVFRADVDEKGGMQVNAYDGTVEVKKGDKQVVLNQNEMITSGGANKAEFGEADDAKEDKDGWIKWNKSRDKLRVMVAVAAYKKNVLQEFEMADAENYIMEKLSKHYLFQVIDKKQLEELKVQEKLKAALKNPGNNAAIAAAGLELGVDFVVNVPIQYSAGAQVAQGFQTVTAKMSEKAIRADTAEPIAYANWEKPEAARGADVTEEAASWKAIKPSLDGMTDSLIAKIMTNWQKEMKKGTTLDILASVPDFNGLNKLQDALGGIAGVKSVQKLYFVANRALLSLTTELDSARLAEKMATMNVPGYESAVVGMSAYRLEVDLKKAP